MLPGVVALGAIVVVASRVKYMRDMTRLTLSRRVLGAEATRRRRCDISRRSSTRVGFTLPRLSFPDMAGLSATFLASLPIS